MQIEELNNAESCFIETIRAFGFLFNEGYHGKRFSIGGREPGITLENHVINRTIHIYWLEEGLLNVKIKREKLFGNMSSKEFSIRDYYGHFNCEHIRLNPPLGRYNIMKKNADFIQQHLMKVIRGELWIDELIKD